jgi:hypothetical protein
MKNEEKEEDEEGEKIRNSRASLLYFFIFLILQIHEWLFFYFLNENYTVGMPNHLSDSIHRL